MSGENWGALGGEQFKGDPQAFKTLATYWGDVSQAFDPIKKPDTDALGVSARNFDSALGEMESAFSKAKEAAEALEKLCNGWADQLQQFQDSAAKLARKAGDAQQSIDSHRRTLEGLSKDDKKGGGKEKSLREDIADAESDVKAAWFEFEQLKVSHDQLERSFQGSYVAPEFSPVTAQTTSYSSLGRRFAACIGQIEQGHPELGSVLEFTRSMLPFEDDGSIKSSFFYNDLLFAHIGGVEKALSSFRLGLGPGSGAGSSKMFAKLTGFEGDVYFPNPLKEKLKLISGFIGSKLHTMDLEGAFKNALDGNMRNLDEATKSLVGSTDELAAGMASSVRGMFPKYSLPIDAVSKSFDRLGESKNVIATNAKVLSEVADGKVGAFAKHLPMVGKLSKRIPVIGYGISGVSNYSEYYDEDKHASSSEGEKRARAAGASAATTGAGIACGAAAGAATGAVLGSVVPGLGTAVGGVVGGIAGGWAGEEGAKATGFDDWAAGVAGSTFNKVKGIFS